MNHAKSLTAFLARLRLLLATLGVCLVLLLSACGGGGDSGGNADNGGDNGSGDDGGGSDSGHYSLVLTSGDQNDTRNQDVTLGMTAVITVTAGSDSSLQASKQTILPLENVTLTLDSNREDVDITSQSNCQSVNVGQSCQIYVTAYANGDLTTGTSIKGNISAGNASESIPVSLKVKQLSILNTNNQVDHFFVAGHDEVMTVKNNSSNDLVNIAAPKLYDTNIAHNPEDENITFNGNTTCGHGVTTLSKQSGSCVIDIQSPDQLPAGESRILVLDSTAEADSSSANRPRYNAGNIDFLRPSAPLAFDEEDSGTVSSIVLSAGARSKIIKIENDSDKASIKNVQLLAEPLASVNNNSAVTIENDNCHGDSLGPDDTCTFVVRAPSEAGDYQLKISADNIDDEFLGVTVLSADDGSGDDDCTGASCGDGDGPGDGTGPGDGDGSGPGDGSGGRQTGYYELSYSADQDVTEGMTAEISLGANLNGEAGKLASLQNIQLMVPYYAADFHIVEDPASSCDQITSTTQSCKFWVTAYAGRAFPDDEVPVEIHAMENGEAVTKYMTLHVKQLLVEPNTFYADASRHQVKISNDSSNRLVALDDPIIYDNEGEVATNITASAGETDSCAATLAAGSDCYITVTTTQDLTTKTDDALVFNVDDRGQGASTDVSDYAAAILNYVRPSISFLNESGGDISSVVIASSQTSETIVIRNNSDAVVKNLSIEPSNSDDGIVISNDTCSGNDLPATGGNNTCRFTIEAPTTWVQLDSSINVKGDNLDMLDLPVTVTAQQPTVSYTIDDQAITAVNLSSGAVSKDIVIKNEAQIAISGLSLSANSGLSIETNSCGASLAAAASCNVTIQAPVTAVDIANASMTVSANNMNDSLPVTVNGSNGGVPGNDDEPVDDDDNGDDGNSYYHLSLASGNDLTQGMTAVMLIKATEMTSAQQAVPLSDVSISIPAEYSNDIAVQVDNSNADSHCSNLTDSNQCRIYITAYANDDLPSSIDVELTAEEDGHVVDPVTVTLNIKKLKVARADTENMLFYAGDDNKDVVVTNQSANELVNLNVPVIYDAQGNALEHVSAENNTCDALAASGQSGDSCQINISAGDDAAQLNEGVLVFSSAFQSAAQLNYVAASLAVMRPVVTFSVNGESTSDGILLPGTTSNVVIYNTSEASINSNSDSSIKNARISLSLPHGVSESYEGCSADKPFGDDGKASSCTIQLTVDRGVAAAGNFDIFVAGDNIDDTYLPIAIEASDGLVLTMPDQVFANGYVFPTMSSLSSSDYIDNLSQQKVIRVNNDGGLISGGLNIAINGGNGELLVNNALSSCASIDTLDAGESCDYVLDYNNSGKGMASGYDNYTVTVSPSNDRSAEAFASVGFYHYPYFYKLPQNISSGLNASDIVTSYIDPIGNMFAGTGNGIYVSTDEGRVWRHYGLGNVVSIDGFYDSSTGKVYLVAVTRSEASIIRSIIWATSYSVSDESALTFNEIYNQTVDVRAVNVSASGDESGQYPMAVHMLVNNAYVSSYKAKTTETILPVGGGIVPPDGLAVENLVIDAKGYLYALTAKHLYIASQAWVNNNINISLDPIAYDLSDNGNNQFIAIDNQHDKIYSVSDDDGATKVAVGNIDYSSVGLTGFPSVDYANNVVSVSNFSNVTALAVGDNDGDYYLSSTINGLVKMQGANELARYGVGAGLGSDAINDLYYDDDRQILSAATLHGYSISYDGGEQWRNYAGVAGDKEVYDVAVDKSGVIYRLEQAVGANNVAYLYISHDGGVNWSVVGVFSALAAPSAASSKNAVLDYPNKLYIAYDYVYVMVDGTLWVSVIPSESTHAFAWKSVRLPNNRSAQAIYLTKTLDEHGGDAPMLYLGTNDGLYVTNFDDDGSVVDNAIWVPIGENDIDVTTVTGATFAYSDGKTGMPLLFVGTASDGLYAYNISNGVQISQIGHYNGNTSGFPTSKVASLYVTGGAYPTIMVALDGDGGVSRGVWNYPSSGNSGEFSFERIGDKWSKGAKQVWASATGKDNDVSNQLIYALKDEDINADENLAISKNGEDWAQEVDNVKYKNSAKLYAAGNRLFVADTSGLYAMSRPGLSATYSSEDLSSSLGINRTTLIYAVPGTSVIYAVGVKANEDDKLLLSEDGGKSWKVLAMPDGMYDEIDKIYSLNNHIVYVIKSISPYNKAIYVGVRNGETGEFSWTENNDSEDLRSANDIYINPENGDVMVANTHGISAFSVSAAGVLSVVDNFSYDGLPVDGPFYQIEGVYYNSSLDKNSLMIALAANDDNENVYYVACSVTACTVALELVSGKDYSGTGKIDHISNVIKLDTGNSIVYEFYFSVGSELYVFADGHEKLLQNFSDSITSIAAQGQTVVVTTGKNYSYLTYKGDSATHDVDWQKVYAGQGSELVDAIIASDGSLYAADQKGYCVGASLDSNSENICGGIMQSKNY